MEWLSTTEIRNIRNGIFDLRKFCARKRFTLKPGRYCRVKFATSGPWKEDTILIWMRKSVVPNLISNSSAYKVTTSEIIGPDYQPWKVFDFNGGND